MSCFLGGQITVEVKIGSKTLAVISIVLVVSGCLFVLDTGSLINPVLDGLSLREPEVTPGAILMVDGYVD
jgi:hypothetical protein